MPSKPFGRPWWKWFGRYRHTRGFGIHSPLAFRIITEIIGDSGDTGYYTVSASHISGAIMSRKDYRRVVGLICLLRPASVFTGDETLDQAISTYIDSSIRIDSTEPEMIVSAAGGVPHPAMLTACLRRGGTVVITDCRDCRDVADVMLQAMDNGISLSGRRMLIAIGRKDLPRQHFELTF